MTSVYELLTQMEIMKRLIDEYINKFKDSEKIAYSLMKDFVKHPEGLQKLIKVAETMNSEDAFIFGNYVGINLKKFFENIFNEIGLKKSIDLIKDIENKDKDIANDLVFLLGILIKSNIDKYDITALLNDIPNDIYKGLFTGVIIQSKIEKEIGLLNLLAEFIDTIKKVSKDTPRDAYLVGAQLGYTGYTEKLFGKLK